MEQEFLPRVYWIQLVRLLLKIIDYWLRHKQDLPPDLTNIVGSALDQLAGYRGAIANYDRTHVRGDGDATIL